LNAGSPLAFLVVIEPESPTPSSTFCIVITKVNYNLINHLHTYTT
jgi:hypothetical protein